MTTQTARLNLSRYLRREPAMLAILTLAAIFFFLTVTGISRIFHAQQDALAARWSERGVNDLNAHRYDAAIPEFRAALLYSRDDFDFRLGLAQALMGLHRTAEAYTYLINLWGRRPENGLVNVELARVAAERGETDQALRYYHNAIYASWPSGQESQARETRFELVAYLLKINAKAQAESELISLAAYLGDDATQQTRLGEQFLRIQDNERALAAFRRTLTADAHNPAALAGAGTAAYDLGRYPLAQRYLEQAVAATPSDYVINDRLKIATRVLEMDPFRRQIRTAQRDRNVVAAFAAAGERLKACPAAASYAAPGNGRQDLASAWAKLKPQVAESGLRRDPDLVNSAMDLVFTIERQASEWCGTPTTTDSALLLIAKLHEGS